MIKKKSVYVWSPGGQKRRDLLSVFKANLSSAEVAVIDGEEFVQAFDAHPQNKTSEDPVSSVYLPISPADVEAFFLHLHHVTKSMIKAEMQRGKHVVVSLEFWQCWPAWAITKGFFELCERLSRGDEKDAEFLSNIQFVPDLNILIHPSASELEKMSAMERSAFSWLLAEHNKHIKDGSKRFFVGSADFSESPSLMYRHVADFLASATE